MVKSLRDDFDLLFGAVDLANGELARSVLAAEGIPSTLHSQGFDSDAEVGAGSRWFQLFVPKGSKKQARLLLSTAWGSTALSKLH